MKCVCCKIREAIKYEKVCARCLRRLRKKYNIPKDQDVLDNWDVQHLLENYEDAH